MPTILVHPAEITNEGLLDKESFFRLKKAFKVYCRLIKEGVKPQSIYFISSVQDRLKEGYPSQSEMMRDILIEWGVPAEQIITSNQSSTTLDDIRNSFQLVKINRLPEPIINVSSWYHIPRIWIMWQLLKRQFGFPVVRFVSANVANYLWIFEEPRKMISDWRRIRNTP